MSSEHLSSFTLDLLHLDALTPADRERADQHLAVCERCQRDADDAKSRRASFAEHLLPRGLPAVQAQRRWWLVLSPVLAAATAVVLVVLQLHPPRTVTPPRPAARPAPELKSPVALRSAPVIDAEMCARAVRYTEEAMQLGIEGVVELHIELDASGAVQRIQVLKGLGHGLDELVMQAFKHEPECIFKPAIATDGRPVPWAFTYKFKVELTE